MKKILNAAGISWGVLAEEPCCGEPACRTGNEALFLELSEKLIGVLKKSGVKNILACCPHCTAMLDADYRQNRDYEALGITVTHHSEFIARILPKLSIKNDSLREIITYHDPCQLARSRGKTKEPRTILAACGKRVKELPRHGSQTFCCGAGGGQIFLEEEASRRLGAAEPARVNHERFAEIADTGIQTVAVACPYCPIMFKDAAVHFKREDISVLDIAEIVASKL